MADETVLMSVDERGVATITLNRPDIHNAFDDKLIERLIGILDEFASDNKIRVVVLRSTGKSFSAGADLNWMRRMASYTYEQNMVDARRLALLMYKLNYLPKPTIAMVQGAAFGGAVGLVACCDIAVASEKASFAFSEARIGLIPATISPYVVAAIGERASRRYFQTAERFDANEAFRLGLVNRVVTPEELDNAAEEIIKALLGNGPDAVRLAKELAFNAVGGVISEELREDTSRRIAERRVSEEGQEGLTAFLEKRKPKWAE